MKIKSIVFLCLVLAGPLRAEPPQYALQDGDTVVFLGDSITAAGGYTKIVEHYTVMRYPQRKVRFINAGQGGDTASAAVDRLERDVFQQGATVVTVAFGINDIGWGTKANAETKQQYLNGIRTIIERCRERNVRPVICSPSITAEDPHAAERGFLAAMADEGRDLAQSMGAKTIDLQREMRQIHRSILAANAAEPDQTKHSSLHAADGVHLTDLGQLAMAYGMIKGLGIPQILSKASMDNASLTSFAKQGCTITELQRTDDGLSFVRLDDGLPLNLGIFSGLNHRFVPMPDLGRYELKIVNLPEGEYEIAACGRKIGRETAAALAEGVNLASMTLNGWEPGGLWNAQSNAVKEYIDARDKLWAGGVIRDRFMKPHPELPALVSEARALDEQLTALIRHTARPVPYAMTVTKVVPPAGLKEKAAGGLKGP